MPLPLKVVIVGAGVGGLATAYGLAYSKHADKFKIQILEHRQAPAVQSQVRVRGGEADAKGGYPIRLSNPGRTALASLLTPLDATLLADAHARLPLTHDGLSIAHDAGKLAFCGKFEPFGKSSMLERGDLMSILRDALKGRGVEVQYGKKVVHVDDGSEGWFALQRRWSGKRKWREGVVVSTEQGDEVRCDFVIGADGMHSAIRSLLYPSPSSLSISRPHFDAVGRATTSTGTERQSFSTLVPSPADAYSTGKVARNYRLSSPQIWDHVCDKHGINVLLSGNKGHRWTATLIPTRAHKGNGDGGEVYCVFTAGQQEGKGLEGCQGGFVDALKRDPGFYPDAPGCGGPQKPEHELASELATGAEYEALSEAPHGQSQTYTRAQARDVSISIQSIMSAQTDASTRPLLSSARSASTPSSSKTVEDEPRSLIEALRALQNTPHAQGFSIIPEDGNHVESETSTVVEIRGSAAQQQIQKPYTTQTPETYSSHLYTCARTYTGRPRIAIIGDAAHGMVPFGGTGASLALRDAEDLVRVLERRVERMEELEKVGTEAAEERFGKAMKALFRGVGGNSNEGGTTSGTAQAEKVTQGRRGRTPHRPVRPITLASVETTNEKTASTPTPIPTPAPVPSDPATPLHTATQAQAHTTSHPTNKKHAKRARKAEKAMRKDMYLFNMRMKRHADPAILVSKGSMWLAMGESGLARGTRAAVFGLGRALGVGDRRRA